MGLLAEGLTTYEEAAERLGLKVATVRRLYGDRLQVAGHVGPTAIIREADVAAIERDRRSNPLTRKPFPLSVKHD